mgnify:CR=1 FL=1
MFVLVDPVVSLGLVQDDRPALVGVIVVIVVVFEVDLDCLEDDEGFEFGREVAEARERSWLTLSGC